MSLLQQHFWGLTCNAADDGEYVANSPIINGAACHSIHHSKFDFNYGQYTTLWDRIGNTYYKPPRELFKPQNIVKRD
jgi:lathosterol oxidase